MAAHDGDRDGQVFSASRRRAAVDSIGDASSSIREKAKIPTVDCLDAQSLNGQIFLLFSSNR